MDAPGWAEVELRDGEFGNQKLSKRLVKIVARLVRQPSESVPEACETWKETKATYRFWDNRNVNAERILEPHRQRTIERAAAEPVVLAIQDTTELNFTKHRNTRGLGMLDHPAGRGLKVHSVLCVATSGVPLGVLHQKTWARDPKSRKRARNYQQQPIQEKESIRWIEGLQAAEESIPESTRVITIGDRESDIFELFARPRRPGSDLLVRVQARRRSVNHPEKYLEQAVRAQQPLGTKVVDVPRRDGNPGRQAELTLRTISLEFLPPNRHPQRKLSPVRVQVILAEEEHPAPDVTPISWLLITTLPVETFEEAALCLEYYSRRWLIERFHYVLKTGCGMEDMELETAARLQNALATKTIVASRLLWMTYQARVAPDEPAQQIVDDEEWQMLLGQAASDGKPEPPQTIHEAVRLIARMGGFLGRKHDGEPGVKVLWRGMRNLRERIIGYQLRRQSPGAPSYG